MTSGGNKTTQTTNTAPWPGAQPALSQSISEAQRLYNQGVGGGIYTGNTYADPSRASIDAAEVSGRLGYNNVDGRGLSGQYQNIIGNYGQTGDQRNAVLNYYNTVGSGGYNDAQRNALSNTQGLANAKWSVSPELQRIIDQTNADANTNVSLANSAGGRYGSGSANSAVADAISKNTNSLLYSDLNNFQTRRDAANSNLFNMGQTGQSNVSSALGNIANIGQQGFNNLGAAYQGLQAPLQNVAQYGQFIDNQNTNALNDRLRIFNSQQSAPWENLSRLNAIASGAGQLGSTSVQSQPGQNPFLTALGYGATGLGLLGGF